MPADGRLADGRGDVDDRAGAALAHPGQGRLDRTHGAHHVDLPGLLPVGLGQLVEAADLGEADVVDEAVDAAEALERGGDRRARARRAAARSAATCRSPMPVVAPAGRHDRRALVLRAAARPRGRSRGRAGDDAHLVLEAEVHGGGYLSRRDDDAPPRPSRRDRLEPRAPLAGARRPAAERRSAARRRARWRSGSPAIRSTRSTRPTSARARDGGDRRRRARRSTVALDAAAARGRRRRVVGPDHAGDRARCIPTGWQRRRLRRHGLGARRELRRDGRARRRGAAARSPRRIPAGASSSSRTAAPMRSIWLARRRRARRVASARPTATCDEIAVEDGQIRWIDSLRGGGLHQQVQG